jgi:hypothetical protein
MEYKHLYKAHSISTLAGVACMLSALATEFIPWLKVSAWVFLPISVWFITNWERKHILGEKPEIYLVYWTRYPFRYVATLDLHFLWPLIATLGIIRYSYIHGQIGLGVLMAINYALMGVVFNGEREQYDLKKENS